MFRTPMVGKTAVVLVLFSSTHKQHRFCSKMRFQARPATFALITNWSMLSDNVWPHCDEPTTNFLQPPEVYRGRLILKLLLLFWQQNKVLHFREKIPEREIYREGPFFLESYSFICLTVRLMDSLLSSVVMLVLLQYVQQHTSTL